VIWHLLHCALASGAVYCNRSCLCVCVFVAGRRAGGRAGGVCYHDNSKLRASIFTKLGLWVKVVTISSWLNFGRPMPPGRGSTAGRKRLAPRYYGKRAVFASLRTLSFILFLSSALRWPVWSHHLSNIDKVRWRYMKTNTHSDTFEACDLDRWPSGPKTNREPRCQMFIVSTRFDCFYISSHWGTGIGVSTQKEVKPFPLLRLQCRKSEAQCDFCWLAPERASEP